MGVHYRTSAAEGQGMWHFMKVYWRNGRTCQWVEPSEGAKGEGKDVLFFRNRMGVGVPPAVINVKVGE